MVYASGVLATPHPGRILKVDASSPGVLGVLHDLGLGLFGKTDRYYLIGDAPGVQGALNVRGLACDLVELSSDLPLYLVYCRGDGVLNKIRLLTTVLLVDDRMVLCQMDEETARRVSHFGGEVMSLPDAPCPAYVPQKRMYPHPALQDTFVQRLVNRVNPDSIRAQIQRLQDFRTRYSFTDSCRSAEQYVFNYFAALGLDSVAFDPYPAWGRIWRNVIGTRVGRVEPQKLFIICGHLDAEAYPERDTLAPGAEDNASGTAMAMEAARILARENLDLTVKFVAFTGEENGMGGSFHYAQFLRNKNVDLLGVLNFDMIAWPGDSFGVSIDCDSASLSLAQFEDRLVWLYTTLHHRVTINRSAGDYRIFQQLGYPATGAYEYGSFYPYYHSIGDTLGNLSMSLATEVAKLGVAALATLTVSPAPPDDFVLRDMGIGGSLEGGWLPSPGPRLAGYKLYWGTASQAYSDSVVLGPGNVYRISGLQNGTRYYAIVVAFDSTGRLSISSPEQSAVPGVLPRTPSNVTALTSPSWNLLLWQKNKERDLAGYNLYRSTMPGGPYNKLNAFPFPDTAYRDSLVLADTLYYYVVAAVDTSQNESAYSLERKGRLMTLDQGILLVDETRDGSGARGSPSDAQQDAFYHTLLRGARYTDWDVIQQGLPSSADFSPYSTIVWHTDDWQDQRVFPVVPSLANYLFWGGKLWFVGWMPIRGLADNPGNYVPFSPGQFPFDYLHLKRMVLAGPVDFIGASGRASYPDIPVDSLKCNPAWRGRLGQIETEIPQDAEVVFTYNSFSGDTNLQGQPVGVCWLNGPYRVVFFGFPFYFMKDSEARQVAIKVLQDLGEPVGVEGSSLELPLTTALLPVYPNPSQGSFRIEYALAAKGRVRLSVFNVSGQLVRELVDVVQPPGRYSASWDGRDQEAHRLPSGVYFYRFQTKAFSDTKKAVVVR